MHITHGPSLPNGRLNETWWISAILIASALGVFVVPPVVASLSDTTKVISGILLFVGVISFIGWGETLLHGRRRTKP